MVDQGGHKPQPRQADPRRSADRAVLRALATQLEPWREAHKKDDREAAIVVLPRETVALLIRALWRALDADFSLEELDARIAQAFLFAKSSPGSEITRLRRAVRFMWTGLDDEDERHGKPRPRVPRLLLARDFVRMTALQGQHEFPFRTATDRAASRPPLTLTCPLHPEEAIDKLRHLYSFPSKSACRRQLQRTQEWLRDVCVSAEEPFLRNVATKILSNVPYDWGDPPVERP